MPKGPAEGHDVKQETPPADEKKAKKKAEWGPDCEARIEDVRQQLRNRGCHHVGRSSAVSLMNFNRVEVWLKRARSFLLFYSMSTGSWDIYVPSDNGGNTPEASFAGLDSYIK